MALAAHLRAPAAQPCPVELDTRAALLYRDMLADNFDAALRACFPIWIRCLGEANYLYWRDHFIAEHACRSPFFRQIPDEFMAYLSQNPDTLKARLPYALELAHLEWLELALSVAQTEELSDHTESKRQNPWTDVLQLNSAHALVQYAHPVHHLMMHPKFTEAPNLDPNPVSLYLYRDRDEIVQMLEPDTLSLQILASLEASPRSGKTLFHQWRENGQIVGDAPSLAGQMHAQLQQMLDLNLIFGISRHD